MKKSVLTGINQIEIIELPLPEIRNNNQVLIRMSMVRVCGSVIHYYKTGRKESQVVEYPLTKVPEVAVFFETVGEAIKMVKPGNSII